VGTLEVDTAVTDPSSPCRGLPVVLRHAADNGPQAAQLTMRAEFATRMVSERLPHVRHHWFPTVSEPRDLVPPDATEHSSFGATDAIQTLLISGPGWVGLVERSSPENACRMTVAAATADHADQVLAALIDDAPSEPSPDEASVSLTFCCKTDTSVLRALRRQVCPRWGAIARNYAPATHDALAPLMEGCPPGEFDGRLILWAGPPGTGKTTAIRSLVRAWKEWADFEYVTDPSSFFFDASYVFDVALQPSQRHSAGYRSPETWKVVIVEDADDFLDPNSHMSQGLGMLLNLTDGMLGQGTRVLFLLTTNRTIGRLHPAVTRRGRALAHIDFRTFSAPEAHRWLGRPLAQGRREYPLCDLYAITRGWDERQQQDPGMYL
jgi:uncharacterized protein DUF5925/ATPase family protein associated with various cellular activities (AAA)